MTDLSNLSKTVTKRKKRLGQGHGSGKGKTGGRGTKGQRSRGKISHRQGIAGANLIRRLPLYRGKYRNKPQKGKPLSVNVKYLNLLPKNSEVTLDLLVKFRIVDKEKAREYGVKILGDGDLTNPLTVSLPVSKGAVKKIEKAGGKVIS